MFPVSFVLWFTSHYFFQIEHLRVLSTEIAPELGSNPELIEDLKATSRISGSTATGAEPQGC